MSRPAPGRLEIVRDFLNTVSIDRGTDELADVAGYRRWLRQSGFDSGPDPRDDVRDDDRRQAVALRDALRSLVACHGGEPLRGGELAAAQAAVRNPALHLSVDDDGTLGLAGTPGRPGQVALAALLGRVAEASAAGAWPRLKLCRLPTCRWAFYDASPARAAVWCTMAVCGARHKARAYRRRQADGA